MAMKPGTTAIPAPDDGWQVGSDAHPSRRYPVQNRHSADSSGDESYASSGFSAIVAEFTACWERGEPAQVEEFLARMPATHPADVVELIYREYCLAESLGLEPHPSDFLRRFPDREESLERLFRLHGALSSTQLQKWVDPEVLPVVGDEIGPYTLCRELGRGSFARVFLAEQSDLDDRLVVVKISTRLTPEPRLLARARHSHIVEVFWHGTAEDGALQLISMPFLGGASFAAVLAERRRVGRRPRWGRQLLTDLDRVSAAEYPRANLSRPAREIMERLTYPGALAWIVARLAEALDHAFSRGVAHGDIKPSNILLTADGTPMLLDFNLAVSWRLPGGADLTPDAGGTLAYMAPERLKAVASTARPVTPRPADRHCADIFALGVVLLEALSCREPDLPQARARSRQEIAEMLERSGAQEGAAMRWLARSAVPSGLRSILARCLAAEPADRYQRASELAEDLDRWRTDRPLTFASEPPRHARLARWARRRRQVLTAIGLALLVGGVVFLVGWTWFNASLSNQAMDKLNQIYEGDESGPFRYHLPGQWEPEERGDPVENARKRLRQYLVLDEPGWRDRDDIRALPEPDRSQLVLWLLEQILRYTRGLGKRPDSPADWQRALALLDRELAVTAFGPFATQRRLLARQLKLPEVETAAESAGDPPPRWMEEYLLGVETEPRSASGALIHFENSLRDRPDSFWSHYRAAAAAYRLGRNEIASDHLDKCLRHRPNNAALHSQRAACLYGLKQYDDALEESTKALTIDPDHAMGTRTQAYIRSQLGQIDSLGSDFRRYALLANNEQDTLALGFRLSRLLPNGFRDALGGKESPLFQRDLSGDRGIQAMMDRAVQLRDDHQYDEALLELDQALDLDSDHLPAHYYRASLLRKLGLDEAAAADYAYLVQHPRLEELIAHYPKAVGVYIQHSSDHLHAGHIAEALNAAHEGLVQANRFNVLRAEAHYNLARACAAAWRTQPEFLGRVVDQLRAVRNERPDFLTTQFEHDRFFDKIRTTVRPLVVGRP